jgi:hypothetical protein
MQPGSYCRIIDARCAQLKIFLKKKSKKEEECISISSSSSQALFPSFVRVEWRCFVGVLWCVSIALSKRQRRRRRRRKKRLDCKCFPALYYLSIWERFFRSLYSHSPSVFTLLFDRLHRTFFNKNVFLQQLQQSLTYLFNQFNFLFFSEREQIRFGIL